MFHNQISWERVQIAILYKYLLLMFFGSPEHNCLLTLKFLINVYHFNNWRYFQQTLKSCLHCVCFWPSVPGTVFLFSFYRVLTDPYHLTCLTQLQALVSMIPSHFSKNIPRVCCPDKQVQILVLPLKSCSVTKI